jgi:hypothetical protein
VQAIPIRFFDVELPLPFEMAHLSLFTDFCSWTADTATGGCIFDCCAVDNDDNGVGVGSGS